MFFKSKGESWFVGFYSNNYEDREHDIITRDAHEEFAKWLEETGYNPQSITQGFCNSLDES